MKRNKTLGWALSIALVILALSVTYWALNRKDKPVPATATPQEHAPAGAENAAHPSFLYGRINTIDGAAFEGRLRWGDGEEAFWVDYFNGAKKKNPWIAQLPPEQRPPEGRPFEILGFKIPLRKSSTKFSRLFMARFGDIARIGASGREVRVTLKSGTEFVLDRSEASDFDDGVRVWDGPQGPTDLDSLRIREIELLPARHDGVSPGQLHGTVRTRQGLQFSGFLQWNRLQGVGSDELVGNTATGERRARFNTLRAIARRSSDSSALTLLDGTELVLSGTRNVGEGNGGVYIDDLRYGRVLVPWDEFERLEFSPGGDGPAYEDFPPGGPLVGSVTAQDGRRLAGRLVFDLDESEFTETLDAPSQGVDYTIPFGLLASIGLPAPEQRSAQRAEVTLRSGEKLLLDCEGDLGQKNAGILIFIDNNPRPEFVPWITVQQIALDPPPAMYPQPGKR